MEKDRFMLAALEEARQALAEDEIPIGAVIVKNGEIIGRGHNRRMQNADPTAHAEIEAIRAAAKAVGDWRLNGCTMYVTLEPCVMCAGAIVQSRIDTVIFGAYDDDLGCAGSVKNLPADPKVGGHTRTAGGLLEEECAALLEEAFLKRRTTKE